MSTDIMERAQLTRFTLDDEEIIPRKVVSDEVPWIHEPVLMRGLKPVLAEYRAALEGVQCGGAVPRGGQGKGLGVALFWVLGCHLGIERETA